MRSSIKKSLLQSGDLIADDRLDQLSSTSALDLDRFGHDSIAARVAELIILGGRQTNVALFGPWGSGKSSFFGLLKEAATQVGSGATVIRYDAWRSTGESFQTHFLANVWDELKGGGEAPPQSLHNARKTVQFDPVAALKAHKKLLIQLGIGAVLVWWTLAGLTTAVQYLGKNPESFESALIAGLHQWFGATMAGLVALAVAIKVFDLAKVTIDEGAPSRSEQFTGIFREYVAGVDPKPLIVFVDELDRCHPAQVRDVLSGLRTFLETEQCSFVVAVDRDAIVQAILADVDQSRPSRPSEPYYATASEFLDKVFQYQISLPRKRHYTLRRFALRLTNSQEGLWGELRADPDTSKLSRVVLTLIPAHVKSPRRVKVLLNSFAVNVRTLEGRGLSDWKHRAEEIAFLTTLRVEFPKFAEDLYAVPDLIDLTLGDQADLRSGVSEIVKQWRAPEGASLSQAADDLIRDSEVDGEREPESGKAAKSPMAAKLNSQLIQYLRRTRETPVDVPGQDLVWMMERSSDSDIEDPELRGVLELAVDREPGFVASHFAATTPDLRRAAINRLAVKAVEEDDRFAQGVILREMCRVAESLRSMEIARAATDGCIALATFLRAGGTLGVDLAPGALRLATATGGYDKIRQGAIDALMGVTEAERPNLIVRTVSGLDIVDEADCERILRLANITSEDGARALAVALEKLPLAQLETLVDRGKAFVIGSELRVPFPRKPDVAGLTAAEVTAKNQDYETSRQAVIVRRQDLQSWLSQLQSSVLDQNDRKVDRDRVAVSWVMELRQGSADANGEISARRELAAAMPGSVERLRHSARNRLLVQLARAERSSALAFSELLAPGEQVNCSLVTETIRQHLSQILEEDWDEEIAEGLVAAVPATIAVAAAPHDFQPLLDAYESLTADEKWSGEDVLARHWYAMRLLIAALPAQDIPATEMGQRIADAYKSREESADRAVIRSWIVKLPQDIVIAALGGLGVDDADSSADRRDVILFRCAAWQFLGDAAPGDQPAEPEMILALDTEDQTEELVSAWLVLQDNWETVGPVWRDSRPWPTVEAVEQLSKKLTVEERTSAWHWTWDRENPPMKTLRALAAPGVKTETAELLLEPLREEGSNHEQRRVAVNVLLTLNPSDAEVRAVLSNALTILAERGHGVDLTLGFELVTTLVRASHGSVQQDAVTEAFRGWVDAHPGSLTGDQKETLRSQGILPPEPKKGLVEGAMDAAQRFLRGDDSQH